MLSCVPERERRYVWIQVCGLQFRFEQCWNCRMHFRPRQLAETSLVTGLVYGRFCGSCLRELERPPTPAEMGFEERSHVRPEVRRRMSHWVFWLGVLGTIGLLVLLYSEPVKSAVPMQWSDVATYHGGSGNDITLTWVDRNAPPAAVYEVKATWFERPQRALSWRWSAADVSRALISGSTFFQVQKKVRMPGTGHFHFAVRSCFGSAPAEECTDWTSSLDPAGATMNGQPRAWWVYVFLEPPGTVTPIP